jgi:hypothetical protein
VPRRIGALRDQRASEAHGNLGRQEAGVRNHRAGETDAGERRTRSDEAAREFDAFLTQIAVPLFRQIAAVLKAEGRMFTVFTPVEACG